MTRATLSISLEDRTQVSESATVGATVGRITPITQCGVLTGSIADVSLRLDGQRYDLALEVPATGGSDWSALPAIQRHQGFNAALASACAAVGLAIADAREHLAHALEAWVEGMCPQYA